MQCRMMEKHIEKSELAIGPKIFCSVPRAVEHEARARAPELSELFSLQRQARNTPRSGEAKGVAPHPSHKTIPLIWPFPFDHPNMKRLLSQSSYHTYRFQAVCKCALYYRINYIPFSISVFFRFLSLPAHSPFLPPAREATTFGEL